MRGLYEATCWYGRTLDFPAVRDEVEHRKTISRSRKRIAISEYGAGANIKHHTEGAPLQPEPRGAFHLEEYQDFVHAEEWRSMRGNPFLWGTFIWNMFDFTKQGRKEW
jgi:beta-galactosidase